MSQYLYLHGWSSSPDSNKAVLFKQKFAQTGLILTIPNLNEPDFYSLSLSRQIQQVADLFTSADVTLLGSSFGALTALWLAQRYDVVKNLILLAPALNFPQNIQRTLGNQAMSQWQQQGEISVFHHALRQEVPISYQFFQDLHQYPDNALNRELPTLILHGKNDEVIPVADAQAFARQRPWIDLKILNSDHGLLNCDLWTLAQVAL